MPKGKKLTGAELRSRALAEQSYMEFQKRRRKQRTTKFKVSFQNGHEVEVEAELLFDAVRKARKKLGLETNPVPIRSARKVGWERDT